jgi:hypothetical protein
MTIAIKTENNTNFFGTRKELTSKQINAIKPNVTLTIKTENTGVREISVSSNNLQRK